MKKVLIIGAGDLGQQFYNFITNYSEDKVVGWVDDKKNIDELVLGIPVKSTIENLEQLDSNVFDCLAIGIGYKHLDFKYKLIEWLKKVGFSLYSFIHPTAFIDKTAFLDEGVFIYPNVTIDQRVRVASGVILNNNVVVSHDSNIESCTFLAPSVTTSGNVQIGHKCFIGTSTVIKDNVKINSSVQTGAGTLVIENIELPGIYVGGPKLRKIS